MQVVNRILEVAQAASGWASLVEPSPLSPSSVPRLLQYSVMFSNAVIIASSASHAAHGMFDLTSRNTRTPTLTFITGLRSGEFLENEAECHAGSSSARLQPSSLQSFLHYYIYHDSMVG
jgi:hypothetical protein